MRTQTYYSDGLIYPSVENNSYVRKELLKAHSLYKVYKEGPKEVWAIRGINLSVYSGEILVILGPSGAGKSTLLHLLGGLDRPTSGKVFLDGIDIYNISERRRSRLRNKEIGFIFQFYHLLPELTALENAMLPAMIGRQRSKVENLSIKEKALYLLDRVGLSERALHRPSQLSGGEAQRIAIARALINRPKIVFCDEPTGNLDSGMSKEICNLIWEFKKINNQTFVIVTHEPSLTEKADRVIHISDGVLK